MVLSKLKADADSYLAQRLRTRSFTCPAYFNDSLRRRPKDAGKIAGLNVL